MKESKVESIGLVPNEWKKCRLKDIYRFEKGKNAQQYTAEYIGENEGDYPVYSGQTENDGIMGKISTYDYDINECIFTTTVGAKCMTLRELKGKFSLSQNCLIMNKRKENINKYVLYALLPLFENEKNKIPSYMQPSLRIEDLQKFNLYLPNIKEQKIIAIFLEEEIEKIDNILKNLNNQIILLNDYKKALITETVTKGLNPNIGMKESNIDWIGSIPKNWNCKKIKYIITNDKNGIKVGPFGSSLTDAVVGKDEGEYKIYGQANLIRKDFNFGDNFVIEKDYKRLINYEVLPNDIAVSMMGTIGKCCVVPKNIKKGIMDSHLIKIRLQNNIVPKYFEYQYESRAIYEQLMYFSNGAIMNGLNSTIVKNIYLVIPNKKEQQEIVDYLDKKCGEINILLRDKQAQIEKMEQYKKSLIYEYVTGKKRVKGAEELYG